MSEHERGLIATFTETNDKWTSHYEGLAVPHFIAKSIGVIAGTASVTTEIARESHEAVSNYTHDLRDACNHKLTYHGVDEKSMSLRDKSIREFAMLFNLGRSK